MLFPDSNSLPQLGNVLHTHENYLKNTTILVQGIRTRTSLDCTPLSSDPNTLDALEVPCLCLNRAWGCTQYSHCFFIVMAPLTSTNIFLKQRSGRKLCCMCLCSLIITLSNVQINEMKNANISLSRLYWR